MHYALNPEMPFKPLLLGAVCTMHAYMHAEMLSDLLLCARI